MTTAARMTRRQFVVGTALIGGGFAFAVTLPRVSPARAADSIGGEIHSWVVIGPDNAVTLRIPQAELGQGVLTTLAQLLVEELHLDPLSVRTEFFDPTLNILRDNIYTYTATLGSLSADRLFDPARIAGAQIRTMLVQAAAKRLQVPVAELHVKNARVIHSASGLSASYAELAPAAAALPVPSPDSVTLRGFEDWQVIGKRVPRRDVPDKVNGTAIFGIDVYLPGMKYASIRQSPVFGGRLKSFDDKAILSRPEVRAVVKIAGGGVGLNEPPELGADDWGMDDAVAVVADSWWQANKALAALPVEWESGKSISFNSETLEQDMAYVLDRGGFAFRSDGDANAALAGAAKTIEAEYWFPYMEHAALEPMNCTAKLSDAGLELWAPTQYAEEGVRVAARVTGLPIERVKLNLTYIGGGFGRRISNDYVNQAAQLAKALPGVPVKLIWTREETFRKGYYPAPAAARLRGGLDGNGNLIAWSCRAVAAKKFDQSYGPVRFPQPVKNAMVEFATVDSPVPFGWMRGVAFTQFVWMNQGFLDELAHAARRDPLEFQLSLLDAGSIPNTWSDREYAAGRIGSLRAVLAEVAQRSNWGRSRRTGSGQGISVSDFSYWTGYRTSSTAAVVEVTLDGKGWLRVDKVFVVISCGQVINPGIVEAQVEGSVGWALSNALYSEITVNAGQVVQGNFHEYGILRIPEMPKVEVHIQTSHDHPAGIGEDAVPVTIAALVNAIYAAGGPRIRSLPIVKHKPVLPRNDHGARGPKRSNAH